MVISMKTIVSSIPLFRSLPAKSWVTLLVLVIGVQTLSSCFSMSEDQDVPYRSPLKGCIYTDVTFTQRTARIDSIGTGRRLRSGKSCSWSLVYLNYFWFETGGSVQAAASEAGITRIAAIEKQVQIGLGAYTRECIIVWGE